MTIDTEIKYILSLQAVRERAQRVFQLAEANQINHFEYHEDRFDAAVQYVANIIKRDFGPDKYHLIPPHGRWQHFEVGGTPRIKDLLSQWEAAGYDKDEQARSLVDLFFVSVLLDAGAGDKWRFTELGSNAVIGRSEGIAVATLHMFNNGEFALPGSDRRDVVLGASLKDFSEATLSRGFQITDSNPFVGVPARVELIKSLGRSLLSLPNIFGDTGRPGNLVDYLKSRADDSNRLDFEILWETLQSVLLPIWPSSRTQIDGHPVGDAWPLKVLADDAQKADRQSKCSHIQPFHKLTQWLAYSLMVPFERLLGVEWKNAEIATGLPEYRNGGLFVDLGVLTLKKESLQRGLANSGSALPAFEATSDEIVEWRALTVALLDKLHLALRGTELGKEKLSLAQVLESGSWKAGRELAAENRPETKSSPILILGDGTLF
ncbi:hypothetical protein AO1008_02668 [Aspergillus oryzae 100-8]|uniref:DUF1688 domain-containing protein n=1 Tax=Aspergillus oryzae (strain 3.042) TaxID=1160506 RepID=I8ISB7_ASPO3|nr:hypothetical protein Ao3042_00557 [Aspergillus oryzae 3.042]KDE76665.1 hypothetical protein AO1008_02668 [Aspergillus oryzae 100-8]|eukprot:EIT82311.1 hypothetical protein Ao3042_00557 [Aspergillus oryzae 3.042]